MMTDFTANIDGRNINFEVQETIRYNNRPTKILSVRDDDSYEILARRVFVPLKATKSEIISDWRERNRAD